MKFDILTLFPEMFASLDSSIIGRAKEKELIQINITNIRDFSKDKHKKVDDTVYGGGAGMLIRPDVVKSAYDSVKSEESKVIYLSPQGKTLTQKKVIDLAKNENHLILLCGHYEGIDQRVLDTIVDEEISIGDYVLTGGEIPAMVLVDTISRYLDGVITEDSTNEESFTNGLLEYPQYTRPEEFEGVKVPDVLISGHHENIRKWRRRKSLEITLDKRPDLLENVSLSEEEIKYIEELKNNNSNK